ncbi:MAG: hypothetical protein M3N29_09000 [Chloroflexota bacterium]|nr:hypothetical protein [Chloroflexota bacterium]
MPDHYIEVSAVSVPRAKRELAERTLLEASEDLGIASRRPPLRWFAEMAPEDLTLVTSLGERISDRLTSDVPGATLQGRTFYGEHAIWIRATQPLEEIAVTTAHEVAHVAAQRERGYPAVTPSELAREEAFAEGYGLRYRRER